MNSVIFNQQAMDETDKENDLKIMKYGNGSTANGQYCKSQELVLASQLQEGAGSSRSHEYKMKNEDKVIFRKKSLLPIFAPNHPYRSACYTVSPNCKNNVSVFTQRIMSAKLLGVRNLQNKLTETQIRLQELVEENRILNALLKRQERALKKYEGEEAQLPQLIKTHSDEMRVLQTKYKQLKATCYELEQKLKTRDNELNCLREQHKHLLLLSKDKHLGEREKLRQQVEDLLETVNSQEDRIKTLMRKVELENKNHKHQLRMEIGKHRETQRQLSQALSSIQKLEAALEVKQKHQQIMGMSGRSHHFSTNATMGALPAISKQVLSSSPMSPLKERLNERSTHEHEFQEKNGSDSNPTTVSSSVPNSEYEGSEASGNNKNQKTSTSSTESRKLKTKQSDSSKSKSKSRSSASYDYNFESSESAKTANSDRETVKNNEALPDIFVNESPELPKNRSEKVSSESSKKSLTRQDSVREDDGSRSDSFGSKPSMTRKPSYSHNGTIHENKEDFMDPNVSRSDSFDSKASTKPSYRFNEKMRNNSGDHEDLTWEEIKKQVQQEHEIAKKKLESFSKTHFDSDLLSFSINNELDNSKKNALLKALHDIDREKNCCEAELHSDSDSSLYKNSKFGEEFMDFYRAQSGDKYSPTDDHLQLDADCADIKEKRNGLVRDWFFNQYDYGVSAKSELNEREKMRTVSTSIRKGSDSSS